jgi:ASC-1-like (ASCH) protein
MFNFKKLFHFFALFFILTCFVAETKAMFRGIQGRGERGMSHSGCPRSDHRLPIINTASRPYLNWLKDGVKTAEGRVNGPACQRMKIGDTLLLVSSKSGQYVHGAISFKHKYASFEEMLRGEGVKNLLPFLNDGDVTKGVDLYSSFPGSERVKEFGCVAIGITVSSWKL